MITPAQLRTRFPGPFDSLTDESVQACIDEASSTISEAVWGSDYDTGLLYLTAHLAVTTLVWAASEPGAIGGVKRRRVGDVEVEFAVSGSVGSSFSATAYGSRYLELRKLHQGGPVVPHVYS